MNIQLIDIHAHVNFEDFDADRHQVIERALNQGIGMINVGTTTETSREVVELAQQYDGIYAIVGLHPIYVKSADDWNQAGFEEIVQQPKVVGIGECGLDYFRADASMKSAQESVFRQQIDLALQHDLPLMLHVRATERDSSDAYHDALDILSEYEGVRANFHFFAGDQSVIQQALNMGCYLSFTGVVTFARVYEDLVKSVPLDRMMVETDCPYVAPVPERGKRNEPAFVQYTASKIARILGTTEAALLPQLLHNTKTFFRL